MPRGTILIIDDDLDVRETMASVLEAEGYGSICAGGGAEALALLEAGATPNVILLDLMMPEMSGRQFRAALLSNPRLQTIPIVVVTAGRRAEDTTFLVVNEVLHKPLSLEKLLDVVGKYV